MSRTLRNGCLFAAALLTVSVWLARPAKSEPDAAQNPPARLTDAAPVDDLDRVIELKVIANLDDVPQDLLVLNDALQPDAPGKFWIGLRCSNVDGAVRAQLGLPEGKGLLIDEVMPDSPAKKAGVEQYDVLLRFGDRELVAVTDLVEAVQKAEQTEVTVSLIRGGKPMTLKVRPAERSDSAVPARVTVVAEPNVKYQDLHSLIEKLQKTGPQGDVHWQVLRPNVIVSKRQIAALPKGMSISVTKSGDAEAKITIQRGNDKWEATEQTLDKLPEDVRKSVEQFLGARGQAAGAHGIAYPPGATGSSRSYYLHAPTGTMTTPPLVSGRIAAGAMQVPDRTQKQLDEIKQQLDELRKAVESLQSRKE